MQQTKPKPKPKIEAVISGKWSGNLAYIFYDDRKIRMHWETFVISDDQKKALWSDGSSSDFNVDFSAYNVATKGWDSIWSKERNQIPWVGTGDPEFRKRLIRIEHDTERHVGRLMAAQIAIMNYVQSATPKKDWTLNILEYALIAIALIALFGFVLPMLIEVVKVFLH